MSYPEFAKWPSIQRLSSETIYITEKIDGTNGVIYVGEASDHVTDEGLVLAGSRARWLTHEDGSPPSKQEDNYGFGAWVHEHAAELRRLGPGYHYGEWHGAGIQRRYGQQEKRFASFEFWRDDLPALVCKVPLLYEGEYTLGLFEEQIAKLAARGSVLYPGFMDAEGIVITFKEMKAAKFKKLCKNDKLHKSQQGVK